MTLERTITRLEKVLLPLTKWLHILGGVLIFVMMLLTAVDVVMRYFFNKPVAGSFELTEYLMVLIISFTLAFAAANDGMVKVTLLSERLSLKTQSIINSFTGILGIGLFVVLAWRGFVFAGMLQHQGIISPILGIPRFPFAVVVAIGLCFLVLVLIVEWLHSILKAVK
jgi:TRAP-type C4-dicarboxylate transport system permease small subunit